MPPGRNVQEPPSPCEFVLPEVGATGLGTTLHSGTPFCVGPLEFLGDYARYVSHPRLPFPYA